MYSLFDNNPQEEMPFKNYRQLGLQIYPEPYVPLSQTKSKKGKSFDFEGHIEQITQGYLSEEDAKEALAKYVNQHCCYSKDPLRKLKIINIETTHYHRYILQTFTESRFASYVSQPYFYQTFEDSSGEPDAPWSIRVKPKCVFKDEMVKLEVPNTSHIESCNHCSGIGTVNCENCKGRNTVNCTMCNGSGFSLMESSMSYDTFNRRNYYEENLNDMYHHNPIYGSNNQHYNQHNYYHNYNHNNHIGSNNLFHTNLCLHCGGKGTVKCQECSNGRVDCHQCERSGYIKWFIELQVKFENNFDDYIKKPPINKFPHELINNCLSHKIFSERKHKLIPIHNYPEPEINKVSKDLINMHLSKYSHCRVVAQRQEIHLIPVSLCTYEINNRYKQFWVYGMDHKVHISSYPKKCCTIL